MLINKRMIEVFQKLLKTEFEFLNKHPFETEGAVCVFKDSISKRGIENFVTAVMLSEDSLWESLNIVLSWKHIQLQKSELYSFAFSGKEWSLYFCLETGSNSIEVKGEPQHFKC